MAFIHSLSIKNYRGIKEFYQVFNTKTVVLIGRGDSGKSTILNAIQAVLTPRWNFNFTDVDFYNCDTNNTIEIEAELIELPTELLRDDKFGLYLGILKADGAVSYDIEDDNSDNDIPLLCVKLIVNSDLEPKWYVRSKRSDQDEKEISGQDRALFNMFMINDYVDNHFSYNRLSPLHRILWKSVEDRTQIDTLLANVVRTAHTEAKKLTDLSLFDDSVANIIAEAKTLGLEVPELKTLLEYKENAYTESNFSLHIGDVPYRQFGKGSKRLLSMAIQQTMIADGGIVLIDEVEQGLEPDRVRHITRKLKEHKKGQVFYTTHSHDAILEPNATDIYLMREGAQNLFQLDNDLQGVLRAKPDAFFAKKIIFCEGATEVGIVRAFDQSNIQQGETPLALKGVVVVDAGGNNKFFDYAIRMTDAGYECLVFCDDDNNAVYAMRDQVKSRGDITLVMCENGKAIEQQLFSDLPDGCIVDIVKYVVDNLPEKDVFSESGISSIDEYLNRTDEEKNNLRILWSTRAKSKNGAWYKNIENGEVLGRVWFKALPSLTGTCLENEYNAIIAWTKQ